MFDQSEQIIVTGRRQKTGLSLAEQCLQAVSACSPVIRETLENYGNLPLAEYLDGLHPSPSSPLQSRQDFVALVRQEVTSLLGKAVGIRTAEEIDSLPMVLTANHLGVDYFSQSVQSNLLFYLLKRRRMPPPVVVPVIACGSVPLNNVTYPLGILLYKLSNADLDLVPKKLPVFANRVKRALVSVAPPFDAGMVERACSRLRKMAADGEIDAVQAGVLHQIFEHDYHAPGVMELGSYARQSLVVNERIWQRLFAVQEQRSHLVTLDMEAVVSRLLEADLHNRESLAWSVLMDPRLRESITRRLDGGLACWDLAKLRQRLDQWSTGPAEKRVPTGCGTLFFWGVNAHSQRIPLVVVEQGRERRVLKGVDDQGRVIEVDLSVDSILSALRKRRLLPSLFTSFTVLAFARGITCLGGYYQGEYLPMMQKELAAALRETGSHREAACRVEETGARAYLSGMQAVMAQIEAGALIPAGPVEIIAAGGLTEKDLNQVLALSVRDAHLASLFDTVGDIAPEMLVTKKGLKPALAHDCRMLRNRVVVK